MRLGLVRRGFSSTGGAENFLRRFAEAIVAAGHEVVLFTSDDWPPEVCPWGQIKRVPGTNARAFADNLQQLQPRQECDFLFSFERVWECDCFRAGDGVHRAWLNRRARYESPWRSWWRQWNQKHRDILELEARLFGGGARIVIANSRLVRNEIIESYGYPEERMHVIYNGISNTRLMDRTAARALFKLADDELVILFAGSGWERKGLKFAIDAVECAKIPNAKLLIAGRGNRWRYRSSKNVRFVGAIPAMPKLFAAADLFLLPTIYDPFSNACLEAAAAGVPVITSASNGFTEIMTAGVHGEIIDDPADVEAMAESLEKWSNGDRRKNARAELQQLAARYDIQGNVEQSLRIIENQRVRV
jgi:UDP-glucose:(heptosyl)LPS alpha-1,3-glucosyltransferase